MADQNQAPTQEKPAAPAPAKPIPAVKPSAPASEVKPQPDAIKRPAPGTKVEFDPDKSTGKDKDFKGSIGMQAVPPAKKE